MFSLQGCTKAQHTWDSRSSFPEGRAQFYSRAVGCYFFSVCTTRPVSHWSHSYWHQHLSESSHSSPVRSPRAFAAFGGKQGQHMTINNLVSGMKLCPVLTLCPPSLMQWPPGPQKQQLVICHRAPWASESNIHFPFHFNNPYWARKSCRQIMCLIQKHTKALNQLKCIPQPTFKCSCGSAPLLVAVHNIHLPGLWESPYLLPGWMDDILQHNWASNIGSPQEYEP